jgi:hypothetical protein
MATMTRCSNCSDPMATGPFAPAPLGDGTVCRPTCWLDQALRYFTVPAARVLALRDALQLGAETETVTLHFYDRPKIDGVVVDFTDRVVSISDENDDERAVLWANVANVDAVIA